MDMAPVAGVFLDRDGVLNRSDVRGGKPFAPTRVEDFMILADAEPSVRRLKEAGFTVVVVTNQPDVGNGLVQRKVVEEMNEILRSRVPVDDIRVCFHSQNDNCNCRKPKGGMLIESSKALGIDLTQSYMVGDRWSDIACGQEQGCFSILVNRGYTEPMKSVPDAVAGSLAEATDIILARSAKIHR